jgi:uncharacterized membrane protein YidH (DUF202 family)
VLSANRDYCDLVMLYHSKPNLSNTTTLGYNLWLAMIHTEAKDVWRFLHDVDLSWGWRQFWATGAILGKSACTFLSWVRTSIALIGFGFAIERFSIYFSAIVSTHCRSGRSAYVCNRGHEYSALVGISMIIVGTALIVYALKNSLGSNKTIASGRDICRKMP